VRPNGRYLDALSDAQDGPVSGHRRIPLADSGEALARWARRRPAAFWLIGGVISGAAGAVATGLAPTTVLAGAAQAVAGPATRPILSARTRCCSNGCRP
jgi:hypothetical protein